MAIKHLDKKSVTEPKRGKVQQEAEQLLRIFSNIYVNSGSALSEQFIKAETRDSSMEQVNVVISKGVVSIMQ